MESVGLVLEGGGMRGVYTAGILEFFLEKELYFPYIAGVSAGACNASSYISKQVGRNKKVTLNFIQDARYLSYRNLWKEKSIFGMDFIFNEIPNKLELFDFETFHASKQTFMIGTTDAYTGKPVYYSKDSEEGVLTILQASSSIPLVAQPVHMNGRTLFDGGISDPIPIKKSIQDGNARNIIVLTRNQGYQKKPFKYAWLAKKMYPQYEGIVNALVNRHKVYNDTIAFIKALENESRVFVFRPSKTLKVGRTEKNTHKLLDLYELGYADAERQYNQLMQWLGDTSDLKATP